MPFYPNQPTEHTLADAAQMRAQLNGLKEITDQGDAAANQRIDQTDANVVATNQRIDQNEAADAATNQRIDQTDANVVATNQRIDNLPPPGVTFPYNGDGEVTGNFKTGGSQFVQGELALGVSDPGGSGESGLRISGVNPGDGHIPRFVTRSSGSDQAGFGIDGCGITGNMGQPSVQHGDLYAADTSTGNLIIRPIRAATQDVVINGVTLHFVNGLFMGAT